MARAAEGVQAGQPRLVTVGPVQYLAVEGRGAPGSQAYEAAIGALEAVARSGLGDSGARINGFEAIYWAQGPLHETPESEWQWLLLLPQPPGVEGVALAAAMRGAHSDARFAAAVHRYDMNEGLCVEVLHRGPYAKTGDAYARLDAYIDQNGYRHAGPIHELYLNDPGEVPAGELLTICRVPVEKT